MSLSYEQVYSQQGCSSYAELDKQHVFLVSQFRMNMTHSSWEFKKKINSTANTRLTALQKQPTKGKGKTLQPVVNSKHCGWVWVFLCDILGISTFIKVRITQIVAADGFTCCRRELSSTRQPCVNFYHSLIGRIWRFNLLKSFWSAVKCDIFSHNTCCSNHPWVSHRCHSPALLFTCLRNWCLFVLLNLIM